jgi:hypothetical protein
MKIYILVTHHEIDGRKIFRACFTQKELRTWLDDNGYCMKQWMVYDIEGYEVGELIEFEKEKE